MAKTTTTLNTRKAGPVTGLAVALVYLAPQWALAAAPECRYCPAYAGSEAAVELGVGYKDEDATQATRYSGPAEEGAFGVLNGEAGLRTSGGDDWRFEADDLGLDSRRLDAEGGRQGSYGLTLQYQEIPNYRDRTSFSPYQGDGERLSLPAGWIAGSNTNDLPTLSRDLSRRPLETKRDGLGMTFTLTPNPDWEVFGHVRHEEKDGFEDLGATFAFNQTVILPVAVDYQTDDFGLGVGYGGPGWQVQVAYQGSLFRNGNDELLWQNPYAQPGDATEFGRLAQAPDNEFHQITALAGMDIGEATHLNAKVAFGRMTQDDDFLAYSVNPLFAGKALPADSLDGEIQTSLAQLRLSSRLNPKLRLNLDYTYSDRDNDTDRWRWDHVVTDLIDPAGFRVNTPYSFTQNLFRAKLAYRLAARTELSGGFDYDRRERNFQSVEETEDRKGWGRLDFSPHEDFKASIKLAYAIRDAASGYEAVDHLVEFNEVQNPLLRIHNLTDRDRGEVGASLSWLASDALTLGLAVDYYRDDYDDTELGLEQATGSLISVDAAFVLSADLSASLFYTHDRLASEQSGQTFFTTPWALDDSYVTNTIGLGMRWDVLPKRLDLEGDLSFSAFRGELRYAAAADYPDLQSYSTALNLRGNYHLDTHQTLRLQLRYQRYQETDWAKDGLVNGLRSVLDLGRADLNEEAVLVSIAYRYRFE